MNQTKLKGNPVQLVGDVLEPGTKAPDFTYVKEDLSEGTLYGHGDAIKVIIAVPSIDTGICQMETRRFNSDLGEKKGVKGIVVSKDLPMAQKRFCAAEGIEDVETASDFRGSFANDYKTLITDGPMKGLSARVVFVVDGENKIRYTEVVDDITHEPNYEEVLKAVESI
ncbi:MAG: thiol peroxidase [Flavobacteriales bacterium]|nr:thiol peroxidase [Flavobacteriales bacterium]